MLSLTTRRKELRFELDGKECSIPTELGLDETRSIGEAYMRAKDGASGDDGKFRGGVDMVEWFMDFAEKYAPGVKGLSFESASELMDAWNGERAEEAGATEGE